MVVPTVLSLGAGVQSSTLALMAAHGEIEMPDCAIFADTMAEPQGVYDWLDWLEKQLPFPVYRVSAGDLGAASVAVYTSKNGINYTKSAPPAFIIDDLGRVGIMMRQCTVDYKITPIRKALREMGYKKTGVRQLIGISYDEAHRMKPARDAWIANEWPLIDRRMKRIHCIRWMESHGYPTPPRSSCYFCPFHSNEEWQNINDAEPHTFARAVQYEKDFQATAAQVIRGVPYLTRHCKPLDTIDFSDQSNQIDLFGNECEGMCGV